MVLFGMDIQHINIFHSMYYILHSMYCRLPTEYVKYYVKHNTICNDKHLIQYSVLDYIP